MNDLEKLNFALEKQAEFAKGTTEWIAEMRTKYADIENNEKMILAIVEGHLAQIAKMYAKKEGENENL